MQPPSFDEFLRRQRETAEASDGSAESLTIEKCPTPGCECGQLHPFLDDGLITGFRCDKGCVYSARRNVFTGDIVYFKLDELDVTRVSNAGELRGIKFNSLGEPYTDWY